jgi:tRNA(Arg) A34 adenosine deaminase TadA
MVSLDLLRKMSEVAMAILAEDVKEKNHTTFIVEKNKILSVGHNQSQKTHPMGLLYGYRYDGIHSELDAFLKLPRNYDLRGCKLINLRLSRRSASMGRPVFRMARPCPCCLKWVLALPFRAVYYTDQIGNLVELKDRYE